MTTEEFRETARERRAEMNDLFLERDTVLSDCGRYRYLLRRTWDHDKPRTLFVMLNPSTADTEIDNATVRSCIRLSRSLGYGSFEVVNLFGLCATDPNELERVADPSGPDNERVSTNAIQRCDTVICAWGGHPIAARKSKYICGLIRIYRPAAYCLGLTKDGAPKQPLYIRTGTPLKVYQAWERIDGPPPDALELLRAIDQCDVQYNIFDCPTGGWMRQSLAYVLKGRQLPSPPGREGR